MPKECFIEKRFNSTHSAIISLAEEIMDDYAQQGYDLSLRQLYYQFISRDYFPNNERSYKMLGVIISDARLAGLLDWDMIRDRGRVLSSAPHWDKPSDIVEQAALQFQIDKWADQPNYIEVMVEKQALEGVLIPVCRSLDVSFMANKGYSSSSCMYEAGKRYLSKLDEGKDVHLIYLGDHDPSGIDMTRDVIDRARLFSGGADNELYIHRVALNMDQVEELNPPENPAKLTDSRANDYIAKFGNSSWELDAIEPRQLADIVRLQVHDLRDADLWEAAMKREDEMKASLRKISDRVLKEAK